jgi:hypothetical protein
MKTTFPQLCGDLETPNGSARSLSSHHSPPCLLEPDRRKGAVCKFSVMQPFLVLIWFRQLQVKVYLRARHRGFSQEQRIGGVDLQNSSARIE